MNHRSDAFVFFGATGDLAKKQIFPALQSLVASGKLDMPIVATGRKDVPLDELRKNAKESIEKNGTLDPEAFEKLAERLAYVKIDFDDASSFEGIKKAIGSAKHPLHYVALPPETYESVAKNLASVGLAKGSRLALEKPYGADEASAKALSKALHASFPEEAIFRIDHFLGKEQVENIVYFRAANPLLEGALDRDHVERIEITMAESFGVEGRAKFYDDTGAIRDVVQNHLLMLAACLTMDLPDERGHAAVRAARSRAVKAMRSLTKADVVRGQVKGYLDEEDVPKDSTTETFAAVRLFVDTERWSGVPIHIRAGKSMKTTATEAVVCFRPVAKPVLEDEAPAPGNRLRFRLGKDATIALEINVKQSGKPLAGEQRSIVYHDAGDGDLPAYARILGDAIDGDPALFGTEEATFESWRVVGDVLDDATPLASYEKGSWGPDEAASVAPLNGFVPVA